MKKFLAVVVVVAIALLGATAAMATIAGGKHDLSTAGSGATGTLSSCQFCHTPHNSNPDVTNAPLWNRTSGIGTTYSLYDSEGLGAYRTKSGTQINAPGAASRTCLSCHDGTVSVGNTYANGNDTITDASAVVGGLITDIAGIRNALIGTSLANDHPVGFTVNTGATAAGLATMATMTTAGFRFYGSNMECATCHDPHGNDYTAAAANSPFLRAAKSTLCSTCHSGK